MSSYFLFKKKLGCGGEATTAGPDQSRPKNLHTYISEAKKPQSTSLGLKEPHIFAKLLAALLSYDSFFTVNGLQNTYGSCIFNGWEGKREK